MVKLGTNGPREDQSRFCPGTNVIPLRDRLGELLG